MTGDDLTMGEDMSLSELGLQPLPEATPMPPKETLPVPVEGLKDTPENRERLRKAIAEIDPDKPETLVYWGVPEMEGLGRVSGQLVAKAKVRDSGSLGVALTGVSMRLRGFKVADIEQAERRVGWIARMLGKVTLPLAIARKRFETVDQQVAEFVRELDGHVATLTRDIVGMNRIYEENLKAYEGVKVRVQAGRMVARDLETNRLPALKAEIATDPAAADRYDRLQRFGQRMERKVNSLAKAREVLHQGLPRIQVMQDNDYATIADIQDMVMTGVEIWRREIAFLLLTRNTQLASSALKLASDTVNDFIVESSESFKRTTQEVRQQNERGIFDAAAIEKAHDNLLETFAKAAEIYEEARVRREAELALMDRMETELDRAAVETKRIAA